MIYIQFCGRNQGSLPWHFVTETMEDAIRLLKQNGIKDPKPGDNDLFQWPYDFISFLEIPLLK